MTPRTTQTCVLHLSCLKDIICVSLTFAASLECQCLSCSLCHGKVLSGCEMDGRVNFSRRTAVFRNQLKEGWLYEGLIRSSMEWLRKSPYGKQSDRYKSEPKFTNRHQFLIEIHRKTSCTMKLYTVIAIATLAVIVSINCSQAEKAAGWPSFLNSVIW